MWLRTLLGDKAFVIALLRRGFFDFSDMRRCAQALRKEAISPGGISQSAIHTPNPELRQAARSARKQEKDALKWAKWTKQDEWTGNDWQRKQIVLLETGELRRRVKSANDAYGFGKGAEGTLTREQAMTLEVFTNQQLTEYMK